MKLLVNVAELNKAIASIQRRGSSLDTDIHVAACSVLKHVEACGDTTTADKLVQAMPKGSRKLALVEFVLAFGIMSKLDAVADKEAIKTGRIFKIDRTKQTKLDEAIETPWTEFRKEASINTAFDAQAAVKSVLDRLTAASTKGMTVQNKTQALEQAQALIQVLSN